MVQYRWKTGRGFHVNAQTAGEHLDRLQRAYGGRLTPSDIVADAKAVNAPLHGCFEWDNTRAAQLHREWQARQLVAAVRIVQEGDGTTPPKLLRAYVNLLDPLTEDADIPTQAYRPMASVLADVTLRQQLLAQARREMALFINKYDEIQELVVLAEAVVQQIDRLQSGGGPEHATL